MFTGQSFKVESFVFVLLFSEYPLHIRTTNKEAGNPSRSVDFFCSRKKSISDGSETGRKWYFMKYVICYSINKVSACEYDLFWLEYWFNDSELILNRSSGFSYIDCDSLSRKKYKNIISPINMYTAVLLGRSVVLYSPNFPQELGHQMQEDYSKSD